MKRRYLLLVVVFAALVAALPSLAMLTTSLPAPHVYKNPGTDISTIRIKAFYVIPANKASSTDLQWKDEINTALSHAVQFHALQFRGRSVLNYDIFPQPVHLLQDNLSYDTTSTNFGNPHALINIGEEIDQRVFKPSGDLYDAGFAQKNAGEYTVMALFYEGVGASGGMIYDAAGKTADEIAKDLGLPASIVYIVKVDSVSGFFILNQDFLRKAPLAATGDTILYHEFAHTIGLPDLFNASGSVLSSDVMGEGRKKPLQDTYIDASSLHEMGL